MKYKTMPHSIVPYSSCLYYFNNTIGSPYDFMKNKLHVIYSLPIFEENCLYDFLLNNTNTFNQTIKIDLFL